MRAVGQLCNNQKRELRNSIHSIPPSTLFRIVSSSPSCATGAAIDHMVVPRPNSYHVHYYVSSVCSKGSRSHGGRGIPEYDDLFYQTSATAKLRVHILVFTLFLFGEEQQLLRPAFPAALICNEGALGETLGAHAALGTPLALYSCTVLYILSIFM